jgi:RimJ/RimL family protein N-acetyltransferase
MDVWSGERVCLRAVEPADIDVWMAEKRAHPGDAVLSGEGYNAFPESESELRRGWELSLAPPTGHARAYSIEHLEDRRLIGGINTFACDARVGMFEYGIEILHAFRRRGHASEAIRILLQVHFDEYRYQKVNTRVHEFNAASISLHESLGFRIEGRVRRAIHTGGRHWDLLLFGLTVEEFRDQKKSASTAQDSSTSGLSHE